MYRNSRYMNYMSMLRMRPQAVAELKGGAEYPRIRGMVRFFQNQQGVLVAAEVWNLPTFQGECDSSIFAFHIHEGEDCGGTTQEPFADAMTHYNPNHCMHPHHAGDMPSLFGNDGYAFSVFLTDRFLVEEVLGRTIIIHSAPDDFTTQPSGNSGEKIACGVIVRE